MMVPSGMFLTRAEWQSSDKDILIVEEDGLATTGDREGTVVMIARFSGMLDETRWTVPREHEPSTGLPICPAAPPQPD